MFNKKILDEKTWNSIVKTNDNILIHGPGGTGKTTLIHNIYNYYKHKKCVKAAFTGIAAVNMGGTTINRLLGIGIGRGTKEDCYRKTITKSNIVKKLKLLDILIIDEISMVGANLFLKMEYICRRVRKNSKLFGGIRLILVGDFYQLPPVNDEWVFDTELWKKLNLTYITLNKSLRFENDKWFNILLKIRKGIVDDEVYNTLESRNVDNLSCDELNTDIKSTLLFSINKDVSTHNNRCIKNIKEQPKSFVATDVVIKQPSEYVELDEYSGMSIDEEFIDINQYQTQLDLCIPKNIQLKKGAQVMLKFNVDPELGLVNGSRGVVLGFQEDSVRVQFKHGIYNIIENTWDVYIDDIHIQRTQIPLILAYSLTIHKCQGLTIDSVTMSFNKIFCDGQAYVALSRVRDIHDLVLIDFSKDKIKANIEVKNHFE